MSRDGAPVLTAGWPVASFPVIDAGTYKVSLRAASHEDLGFAITFDGSSGLGATTSRRDAGTELAGLVESLDVGATVLVRRVRGGALGRGLRQAPRGGHPDPSELEPRAVDLTAWPLGLDVQHASY